MESSIKLPRKASVLGTEYTFFYSSDKEDPKMEGADGYIELLAKEIHIESGLFEKKESTVPLTLKCLEEQGKKVIRHELIHAFITESGLHECCSWAENEEMVDWMARQFPKMASLFTILGVL